MHTQGPWHLVNNDIWASPECKKLIAVVAHQSGCKNWHNDNEVGKGNARLIANAPSLKILIEKVLESIKEKDMDRLERLQPYIEIILLEVK